jgi:hypothetical protein
LKKILLILILFATAEQLAAQPQFSIVTDVTIMRNFSPKQQFWAVGQTVAGNIHFTPRESGYVWISYFIPGKFNNSFRAQAKDPSTTPAQIDFKVAGSWRNREVSIGWLHYFKGAYDEKQTWSLYTRAGFGLMFTQAQNRFRQVVDTSLYQLPAAPIEGNHTFNRLTVDLGLGAEFPLGGNFFVYGEARTWIPSSNYPSPVLHNNKNVPLPVMASCGMRILFDFGYY